MSRFLCVQLSDDGPEFVTVSDESGREQEDVLADLREFDRKQGREPGELRSGRELGRALASMLPQRLFELSEESPSDLGRRFALDVAHGFAEGVGNAILEENAGAPRILSSIPDGS
jgi:hypothetical protein